ncbi:MAG: hypothetical protein IAF02_24935, partial [Anaerolineae bacterium]|nr:hypothetical protein [Anaerolineae bacterium]
PNSWTKHREVYPASAAESNYVDATFDQTNRAHVVWVEGSGLAYANSSNLGSGFGNYKFFTKLSTNSVAYNPKVVTYGNNVHIIWSEGGDFSGTPEEVGPNIYHVQYYKNNLNVWGWSDITAVTYNTVQSEKPAFAVDPAGNLHVVYQQQVDASHYNILYAKGTFNGSTITWEPESNHAVITSNIPAGAYTMVEPSILYSNGRLEVSATQVFDAPNPKEAASYIYYITCDTSCNESNNWDATRISEANGGLTSALYVDITPSNIVSSIVRLGSCTSIVFDGKVTSTQDDKEQIFDSSSCNGWGDGRTELTENDESRTIQPVATTQYGWWMYVVYEEFVNLDSSEKIYFMRNIPSVYLPMISKPK